MQFIQTVSICSLDDMIYWIALVREGDTVGHRVFARGRDRAYKRVAVPLPDLPPGHEPEHVWVHVSTDEDDDKPRLRILAGGHVYQFRQIWNDDGVWDKVDVLTDD